MLYVYKSVSLNVMASVHVNNKHAGVELFAEAMTVL